MRQKMFEYRTQVAEKKLMSVNSGTVNEKHKETAKGKNCIINV